MPAGATRVKTWPLALAAVALACVVAGCSSGSRLPPATNSGRSGDRCRSVSWFRTGNSTRCKGVNVEGSFNGSARIGYDANAA